MGHGGTFAMSAGLRGNVGTLRRLEQTIRELPRTLAHEVASASASTITELARRTFNASQNAYGDAWDVGAEGQRVTMRKSGRAAAGLAYVATGTRLRSKLGPHYMRYQVGKRNIFPRAGAKLPALYVEALAAKGRAVIAAHLAGALR